MEDEFEKFMPQAPIKRTVSLRVFVATVACLGFALVVVGLGLGLPRSRSGSVPSSSSLDPDASSPYGLPSRLPTVSPADLVNATELDLKTGFHVSANATVRGYEFNITQAYAAPDGFYKPMILVNGQSPGPLIEANNGDTIRVRAGGSRAPI